MGLTKALVIKLEAKSGHEAEVEKLQREILDIVRSEPATSPWFGFRLSESVFGIFEAFPDEAGRKAHLTGRGADLLQARGSEILKQAAKIDQVDVLMEK